MTSCSESYINVNVMSYEKREQTGGWECAGDQIEVYIIHMTCLHIGLYTEVQEAFYECLEQN